MKKGPTALLVSALVIAAVLVFAAITPAISQQRGAGFMVASDGRGFVWRVNTVTGAVSYCVRRADSTDPAYIAANPPSCSAWSPAVE
jgi:hypothetical protein